MGDVMNETVEKCLAILNEIKKPEKPIQLTAREDIILTDEGKAELKAIEEYLNEHFNETMDNIDPIAFVIMPNTKWELK